MLREGSFRQAVKPKILNQLSESLALVANPTGFTGETLQHRRGLGQARLVARLIVMRSVTPVPQIVSTTVAGASVSARYAPASPGLSCVSRMSRPTR